MDLVTELWVGTGPGPELPRTGPWDGVPREGGPRSHTIIPGAVSAIYPRNIPRWGCYNLYVPRAVVLLDRIPPRPRSGGHAKATQSKEARHERD
jgi:hypothetical protein